MPAKEQQPQKMGIRIKALQKLVLQPETRNEPAKGRYPGGRFKRFFDVFRSNYAQITVMNAFALLFLLPLIGGLVFVSVVGIEGLTYMLHQADVPYVMGDIGMGLSSSVSAMSVQASMVTSYRLIVMMVVVGLAIFSFGFGGLLHITTKMVWGESFICKRDKAGNEIPRIALEFFRGVKLYWKKTVPYTSLFALFLGGTLNMILLFVEGILDGTAGVGHYFALIFGALLTLVGCVFFVNFIPTVVSYADMKLKDRIKNAALFSFAFFVSSLFIVAFIVAPFLLTLIGGFMVILVAILLVMFGASYVSLVMVNYADGNSENILVPLYEQSINPSGNKKRRGNRQARQDSAKNAPKKEQKVDIEVTPEPIREEDMQEAKREAQREAQPKQKKAEQKPQTADPQKEKASAQYNKRYQNKSKKKK